MNSMQTRWLMRSHIEDGAAVLFPPVPLRRIGIRFVAGARFQPQIKTVMKPSAMTQNKPTDQSLFQVAANFERVAPASAPKLTTPPDLKPFADALLHSGNLRPALKAAKSEPAKTDQKSSRGAAAKKGAIRAAGEPSGGLLVKTEFYLEAPLAKSVKLAADFTEWDKSPLDLVKAEDGVWQIVIPLPRGDHAYRYIVDGQWCDDPRPVMRVPNPFGTANTIMRII